MEVLKVMGVIFVALVALDNVDGDRIRIRVRHGVRLWRKDLSLNCPKVYGVACRKAGVDLETGANLDFRGMGCKVSSNNDCASQKRVLSPTTAEGLQYVPLPPQFEYYDINGDQKITFEEFSTQILARYQIRDPVTLKTMFDAADVDGDGVLEPDEFSTAPFIQVSVRDITEIISHVQGRNAIDEKSENEPSQTSEH